MKKKLFAAADFEIQKEQRRKDVKVTLCTPHQHLFRPENECLPGKGHRTGGIAALVAHNYYKAKEPTPIDPDDIPDCYKPEFMLKQKNRSIPSSSGPRMPKARVAQPFKKGVNTTGKAKSKSPPKERKIKSGGAG